MSPRLYKVLRALSRFDSASVVELAESLGDTGATRQRALWSALQSLTVMGLCSRDGERGHVARYSVTDTGRMALKQAA